MKNSNTLIQINNSLSICIKNEMYEDFCIKPGMVIIKKPLAEVAFRMKNIASDAIVSYRAEENEPIYSIWVKKEDKWERTLANSIFEELSDDLDLLLNSCNELALERISKKPDGEIYTGKGFRVTDQVAGDKCNNGGEYGFYTDYVKTKILGLYARKTWTTCDFDSCGTGFEGFEWLTVQEAEKIKSESLEAVEELTNEASKQIVAIKVIKEYLKIGMEFNE